MEEAPLLKNQCDIRHLLDSLVSVLAVYATAFRSQLSPGAPIFSLQVPPSARSLCCTAVGTCCKCLAFFIHFSQFFLYRVASGTWIVACACASMRVQIRMCHGAVGWPGQFFCAASFLVRVFIRNCKSVSVYTLRRAKLYWQSRYSY